MGRELAVKHSLDADPGVAPGTYITRFGTGAGGNGTYTVSVSQTVASTGFTVENYALADEVTFRRRQLSGDPGRNRRSTVCQWVAVTNKAIHDQRHQRASGSGN